MEVESVPHFHVRQPMTTKLDLACMLTFEFESHGSALSGRSIFYLP